MSALVSSFVPVEVGKGEKVIFLLVAWTDFVNGITTELEKHREAFGEALGLHATVVQAYRSATQRVFEEVKRKAWPPEVDRRIGEEQYPFMLVIENNFDAFDPSLGRWSVVWFSDLADKPEVLWRVFAALAKKIQRGEDIFKYLESLSRGGKYDAIAKYIEVKPGLFGTTVNVKAIAEDLLGLGAKNAT